ncbi:DUF6077 domain-containing protein [Nocardioides sp. GXZ039]|uniref:DUF6077 domain-containing protein n=1 Tax=Nocardioides sp. GXZ039 TaxID=3136018 RepID=UPI0030F49B85
MTTDPEHDDATAASDPPRPAAAARAPLATRLVDGGCDGLIVAFALWTLTYEVVLAARGSAFVPAAVWIGVAIVAIGLGARREARAGGVAAAAEAREPVEDDGPLPATTPGRPRWLVPALAGVYVAVLAIAVIARGSLGVEPAVVLAVAGSILLLWNRRRTPAATTVTAQDPIPDGSWARVEQAVAGAICLGLGVLASLLVRPDADDVFYVNRGTWVAEHGVPALRDTMFGPETLDSIYGGGLPLSSIETLFGALADLAGVRNGAVTYLWAVPFLAFLLGWALWRLIRAWAPALPLAAFAIAVGYLLISAQHVVGNYSIGRIWQGKVIATCVLIPIVLVHLGRLLEGRDHDRYRYGLLLAAGIAFVGLTSAAPLMAMSVAGAALVAAALARSARLALGAVAFLVGPLVAGVVVALGPAVGGEAPIPMPRAQAFAVLVGPHTAFALVGIAALVGAVLAVRAQVALLAGCCALAALAALLPGVFDLVNVVTGAGPVAWRLFLVAPLAAFVGLLGARAISWLGEVGPSRAAMAGIAVVAGAATALALVGTPQWSASVGARLTASPQWKLPPDAFDDVALLMDRMEHETAAGPWMLPPELMSALNIYTTERFPVVPRQFYLSNVPEADELTESRVRLYRTWTGQRRPSPKLLRADLIALDVGLACVPDDAEGLTERLEQAVKADLEQVGPMLCHVGPTLDPDTDPDTDS